MKERKEMTCAVCGELKPVCNSVRNDGIQQPRYCQECLMKALSTGDYSINDIFWIKQLAETEDTESLTKLREKCLSVNGK